MKSSSDVSSPTRIRSRRAQDQHRHKLKRKLSSLALDIDIANKDTLDANRTAFKHEPLDDKTSAIRLLRLQPRCNVSEEIAIEFFQEDASDGDSRATTYRALSYTWGPPKPRRTITANNSSFEISQNLYDFLAMFSEQIKEETVLWIDQLCIDQSNVKERNRQVGLMGSIYENATEAIIWLGLPANDTGLVFQTLRDCALLRRAKLTSEIEARALMKLLEAPVDNGSLCIRASFAKEGKGKEHQSVVAFAGEELQRRRQLLRTLHESVKALFERSYWTRLWICQEVLLGSSITIFCGKESCPGPDFKESHRVHWEDGRKASEPPAIIYYSSAYGGFEKILFTSAITNFASNECQDPRDKIFGLAAISEDYKPRIDYSASVENVFAEACLYIAAKDDHWAYDALCKICDVAVEAVDDKKFATVLEQFKVAAKGTQDDAEVYQVHSLFEPNLPGLRDAFPLLEPYLSPVGVEHVMAAIRAGEKTYGIPELERWYTNRYLYGHGVHIRTE